MKVAHVGHEQPSVGRDHVPADEKLQAQSHELRRDDHGDEDDNREDQFQWIREVGFLRMLNKMGKSLPFHGHSEDQCHKDAALKWIGNSS